MPLAGFTCPLSGTGVPIQFCLKECRQRCFPPPVLVANHSDRKPEKGVYHVTEVLNPLKQIYLMRHCDYYVTPASGIYASLGTGFHGLMELCSARLIDYGVLDPAVIEKSFSAEISTPIGKFTLAGKADRYEPDTKTLIDFKTEKIFPVKKYLSGDWEGSKYLYQLNIYRTYLFPEAERLMLACVIKDHGFKDEVVDGIEPIVMIEVPILDSEHIRQFVAAKGAQILRNELDPSTIPDCQPEDIWKDGMRCRKYCPVVAFCPQGKAVAGGSYGAKKERKNPRRNHL